MMTIEDLFETWRVNNAVCVELLKFCSDDSFDLKPGRGKTIRSQFVHLINVRSQWIAEKLPDEATKIAKLDWKTADRNDLLEGLKQSGEGIEALLSKMDQSSKGRSPISFFGYIVAHDSHHRAQIELTLRLNDCELEDKEMYGLWDWNKKRPEV